MSKRQLQKDIRRNGGYLLSDGTCNLKHLLPKAYDLIQVYRLRGTRHGIGDLLTAIRGCFTSDIFPTVKKALAEYGSMGNLQYHGRIELKDYIFGDNSLDPHDVWDAACNFLDSISPAGYYFGSQESDGACIGWFKYEKESV